MAFQVKQANFLVTNPHLQNPILSNKTPVTKAKPQKQNPELVTCNMVRHAGQK